MSTLVERPPKQDTKRSNPRWLKVSVLVLLGGAIVAAVASFYVSRIVRSHLVAALETHYHSKVDLQDFSVLVFPRVHITGDGLVLRQGEDASAPPFIKVNRFSADASIFGLLRRKKHIASVTLHGLEIHIGHSAGPQSGSNSSKKVPEFVIEEVSADDTKLIIHPRDPKKDPLEFSIHELSLRSAGTGESMKYKATLTNPTPPGKVESSGYFGPFNIDDAGKSPLKGDYTFINADLGHFKGISGTLASKGKFSGVLEQIDVMGHTDVPDFAVRDGHPVHLITDFSATVDGTDGDTYLHDVRADFLHTRIDAKGKIEGVPGEHGKNITLTVNSQQARIEDLLALVVSAEPPLRGEAELHAQFELPHGKGDVLDRLRLIGAFGLEDAKFADVSVQQKIAKLSERGKGNTSNNFAPGDTASDFAGHFTLSDGIATFSQLSFFVPGASVNLHGTYNLDSQALDFHGDLHLQAELSQMTSGVKSFFAKLVQPLFNGKKGKGKTDIPIKIGGTRANPDFGLDTKRVLH